MHCPAELSRALRNRLLSEALHHGKAVIVGPFFDTIKRVEESSVQETLDRDTLRWPLAWGCTAEFKWSADPPPADWFEGAYAFAEAGPRWDPLLPSADSGPSELLPA